MDGSGLTKIANLYYIQACCYSLGEGVEAGDEDTEAGGGRVQAVEGVGQEGAEGGRVGEEGWGMIFNGKISA